MKVASRKELADFAMRARSEVETRDATIRRQGEDARRSGVPIAHCPHSIGSYVSVRWMEGWSGKRICRREYLGATGWNMMPAQEIASFTDWLVALELPADQSAQMLKSARASYVTAALPTTH